MIQMNTGLFQIITGFCQMNIGFIQIITGFHQIKPGKWTVSGMISISFFPKSLKDLKGYLFIAFINPQKTKNAWSPLGPVGQGLQAGAEADIH